VNVESSISFNELFEKYQYLVTENSRLKEEIKFLKAQMGVAEPQFPAVGISESEFEPNMIGQQAAANDLAPGISKNADEDEKIRLFMSLFKGRDDVYARRWENKKKGTSG
jgi:hypothetical protein